MSDHEQQLTGPPRADLEQAVFIGEGAETFRKRQSLHRRDADPPPGKRARTRGDGKGVDLAQLGASKGEQRIHCAGQLHRHLPGWVERVLADDDAITRQRAARRARRRIKGEDQHAVTDDTGDGCAGNMGTIWWLTGLLAA